MLPKLRRQDEIIQSLAGLDEITRPIHNLRIVEARVTFWSAIALLGIGTVILVIGALGSGAQLHSARLATGALLNLIGGAILKLHRDVHAKLDRWRHTEAPSGRACQARPIPQRPGSNAYDPADRGQTCKRSGNRGVCSISPGRDSRLVAAPFWAMNSS